MPTYVYVCDKCGATGTETKPMSRCAEFPPCPNCRKPMRRDWGAERSFVVGDPEFGSSDVDDYCRRKDEKREVAQPVLSRSLARVPGLNKITGPDGRRYAIFSSRSDRARKLKGLGLVDLD